jgi:threonine dehydratase
VLEGTPSKKDNRTGCFSEITIREIWEAKKRISSSVHKTPLIPSSVLSEQTGSSVYLKLENMHEIGAFKVRGAANKILSLDSDEKRLGVTTFSTGNHGLAVAFLAKQLGIKAIICISSRVPKAKVDAIRRMGAVIKFCGNSQDEAESYCYKLQKEKGLTVIKPFDDPYVIAGQGTIGLELLEELPEIDRVIVPLSGGGLLAGVGLALKSTDPTIQVNGVCMEHSAVMNESLKVGKPVLLQEKETLADSLLGGIGLENQYTFKMVKQYMDEVVLISEQSIAKAMAFVLKQHRMVVEGAAAIGAAALLERKFAAQNENIVVIISGNNVELSSFLKATQSYL